jgi:imidazolonepropionase-like amidohydrolase
MKNKRNIFLVTAAMALFVTVPIWSQKVALTGATIIDGNGGEPIHNGVIVIEDKKIVAVGPSGKVSVPADAKKIDVGGKYIIPGMMDANVHLVPWPSWGYIEFLARYENNFDGIIEEGTQVALKNGLTTVFDSMGPLKPLMRVRDRINNGEVEGSRMYVAGDIVGFRAVFTTPEAIKSATHAFQERMNNAFEAGGGPDLVFLTPEQLYDRMTKYVAQGVDFVKYGATGDGAPVNSSTGESWVLRFTPDQQKAMVAAVHAAGKIIQTHQDAAEPLKVVVEVGNDMAQHCAFTGPSPISDATIKMMLDKHFYCGTQWDVLTPEQEQMVKDNKFPGNDQDNGKQGVNYDLENSVRLIKAGVPELVSTDAGTTDPDVEKEILRRHGSPRAEIGEAEVQDMIGMRQRGMTPMMILQASTKNIAAAYRKLDMIGTLEPGKMADLVVLTADPLADIENVRKIAMVMKEGKMVDRDALPRHPILTSPEAMNPGEVRMK